MKNSFLSVMLFIAALTLGSCGSDDGVALVLPWDDAGEVPLEPGFENLTEAQLDGYVCDLYARSMLLDFAPDASYNDINLIDHYLNGLAYVYARETRGIWSQLKAFHDFREVLKDANKLHRTTLIGAMATYGYSSKAARESIYKDIVKSGCLPKEYNSYSCDQFWTEFSLGNLDRYARKVYNAVMAKSNDGFSQTGDFAADLASNHLRHIDLTLAVAPKLLEAGANIAFAFGDDLISNGKLAYDFVNTNGDVILQVANGNLTAETFMDACNNNLKLLSKGLKEIVPTTQELTELLSDLTTEQIKALNKEIEQAIKEAGDSRLTKDDVSLFVENVREIIKPTPWKMTFADIEYEAKDGTILEIESKQNQAYQLTYSDRFENVLLEAKCVVRKSLITIRVDYLDERCDLLPKGTQVGDIVLIPYQAISTGSSAPDNLDLWWNSSLHNVKFFHMKRESMFTHIRFAPSIGTKNGSWVGTSVFFYPSHINVTRQQNSYRVVAEKEETNYSYTLIMEMEASGLNYGNRPDFKKIKKLEYWVLHLGKYNWKDEYGNQSALDNESFTVKNLPLFSYVGPTPSSSTDDYCWFLEKNRTSVQLSGLNYIVKTYSKTSGEGDYRLDYDPSKGAEISVQCFYVKDPSTNWGW